MELDGRYRLDRLTGTGETAEIWHGADRLLHRPVAIRIPRHTGPDVTDQFLAGGRTAARLVHANIAAVWDVGLADLPERGETPYVIMELADGPSLDVRLEPGHPAGPVTWRASARIGAQVAAALAHAHGQWVTHGGLTPAKILLSDVGAKVIGFTGDTDYDPEAAAADVRALGAVLAACVGGRVGDGVPATLFELVERCLSADAAARPSSDEVALVLAELSGTSVDLPAWLSEAAESRRTAVLAAIRPEASRDAHPSLASRLFRPGRLARFGPAGRATNRRAAASGSSPDRVGAHRADGPVDVEFVNLDRAAFADHATDAGGRRLGYVDIDHAAFTRHSAAGREHCDSSPTVYSDYAALTAPDDRFDGFLDQNPTVFAAHVPDGVPNLRTGHFADVDADPGAARQGRPAGDADSDRAVRSLRRPRAGRLAAAGAAPGTGPAAPGSGWSARLRAVGDHELVRNVRSFVRGEGSSQPRRWAFRTGAVTAGLALVMAGAVGAVGSSVNGSMSWFGRAPQVAAVPPAIDAAPTAQDVAPAPSTAPTTEGPKPTATATTAKNRPVTSTTHPTRTTTTAPPVIPPTEGSTRPTTSPTSTPTTSPTPTKSPTTSPAPTEGSPEPTGTGTPPPAGVETDPATTAPATAGPPPGFTDVSGSTDLSD
ncbi:protein kinase family protein [Dactylosporangium matsuzakiense]|uniref:hypothetical protein n=1 Tax=Dactylosporangium matsuzakiense TaxID=53360 RepID=UPI0021C447BF|nr:hypothetical protein [Dactylosporangium matsuzakiense]UWZ47868.1 hypothetical protein Dmats_16565 [Dactylosporangium matsuzakiense]